MLIAQHVVRLRLQRISRSLLLITLLWVAFAMSTPVQAVSPTACADGVQSSGAIYRICMPTQWNNRLIVYAHGYVAPNRPVAIPEDQMSLPGSSFTVDQLVTGQGYAFVTTSYRVNGMAIQQGIPDLLDAVTIFTAQHGEPEKVILVGVSEGGAMTVLAVEQYPDVFDGGLALCGPYGSFRGQVDYFGDFRVLFDYFLPDVLPASAVDVPNTLLESWESSYYTATVLPALTDTANATAIDQLLAAAETPFDSANSATKTESIKDLLWYNVFATNDARAKLGGQPFDNHTRLYGGSNDNMALNQQIARFTADQVALDAVASGYETTGQLTRPLITLHTTGDPIVPYWQATEYRGKTLAADNLALHENIAVQAYGHCRFSTFDVLGAFARLVTLVDTPPAYQPVQRAYLPLITSN